MKGWRNRWFCLIMSIYIGTTRWYGRFLSGNRAARCLRTDYRQGTRPRGKPSFIFQPAPTQEEAAELIDVPFSTYRRHLRAGLDYVVAVLWQQELMSEQ